jgi:hypothetical protein
LGESDHLAPRLLPGANRWTRTTLRHSLQRYSAFRRRPREQAGRRQLPLVSWTFCLRVELTRRHSTHNCSVMEQFFCPNGKPRRTMARRTEVPVRLRPVSSKFSIASLGFRGGGVNGTVVLLKQCRNPSVSYLKCGLYFDLTGALSWPGVESLQKCLQLLPGVARPCPFHSRLQIGPFSSLDSACKRSLP